MAGWVCRVGGTKAGAKPCWGPGRGHQPSAEQLERAQAGTHLVEALSRISLCRGEAGPGPSTAPHAGLN